MDTWRVNSDLWGGGGVVLEGRPYELDMGSEPHMEIRVKGAGLVLDERGAEALLWAMMEMVRVPRFLRFLAARLARGIAP